MMTSRSESRLYKSHHRPQPSKCEADFVARYQAKTRQSQLNRRIFGEYLADSRASVGGGRSTEPIGYPIVGRSAEGAWCWDIDGNEYIDFTMGFGVNFFGHKPDFLPDEIENVAGRGLILGPQSDVAGDVARRICAMTETERLCFSNSGTEAVMTAIRLARLVTGKPKIAIFWGAYHGFYDATLARPRGGPLSGKTPVGAPGVTESAVSDTIVLRYGDPLALEAIESRADEIAAVLVEPVQSRNPGLQPKSFLYSLREITQKLSIALVFDDVLLGFRIGPTGSKGWAGVDADIITYGKLIGGGAPIGITAGSEKFLNAIDGGFSQSGTSKSCPTTIFAGTFNKNMLSTHLSARVLDKLEAEGAKLRESTDGRCRKFVSEINTHFERENIPVKIDRFKSIFRFNIKPSLNIFYNYLLYHGIYIWEGRTCFFSTQHDDAVMEEAKSRIFSAIQEMKNDEVI